MGSTAATVDFSKFYNTVNGKSVSTTNTRHGINPSTGEPNAEVPLATREDVDEALEYAKQGAEVWADTPIEERQKAILAYGEAVEAHTEELAKLLTLEQGKPLNFAKDEIALAVSYFKTFATYGLPDTIVEDSDKRKVITRYTPLGVAVGIVPWNFPVFLASGKIAPALISGCAFVLKPSPFTPYCGLKLAEIAQPFFPPGVFTAISGDDNLGPWLTEHPAVDKVSFTGSTATGKRVMESCSKSLKSITLELGGNDPAIVCSDVDVKAIAPQIAMLALYNSGQVCIAIKRVYIHSDIYDELVAEIANFVKNLPVGDGFGANVLGPVQNKLQFDRIQDLLKDIDEKQYKVIAGTAKPKSDSKGFFITPTVVENPPEDSRIVVEEPFGPVFPVLKWTDEADVIRRANNTDVGLGSSVWSRDLVQADRIAKKIKAGNVWINTHMELRADAAFGGYKDSGIGHAWGKFGVHSFTHPQTITIAKA